MLLAFHLKGSLIIKAEMHVFEFECQVTQVSPIDFTARYHPCTKATTDSSSYL